MKQRALRMDQLINAGGKSLVRSIDMDLGWEPEGGRLHVVISYRLHANVAPHCCYLPLFPNNTEPFHVWQFIPSLDAFHLYPTPPYTP